MDKPVLPGVQDVKSRSPHKNEDLSSTEFSASLVSTNPNLKSIISPALKSAIVYEGNLETSGSLGLSNDQFEEIKENILEKIAALNLPYHNEKHTLKVLARVQTLAEVIGLDESEIRLLSLAALFHDYGHSGNSYRQATQADKNNLSNEEYAALIADEHLLLYLNVRERLVLQGLVLSTSFDQKSLEDVPNSSYQRDYEPHTKLEKILAFADVFHMDCPFDEWITEGFSVIPEMSPEKRPVDMDSYIKKTSGFLGYVQAKLDDLKEDLPAKEYRNFAQEIDEKRKYVDEMNQAGSVNRAKYSKELAIILDQVALVTT